MNDPVLLWLFFGAGLIVFEALTMPGLGIFLAGLGALVTAIIIKLGFVDAANLPAQFAWFFGLTTLWAIGLWKPLQKFRVSHSSKDSPPVQDIVGGTAVVGKHGLKRGHVGQAHWSGTVMSASIDAACPDDFIPEGTAVYINSVTGTILNVSILNRS